MKHPNLILRMHPLLCWGLALFTSAITASHANAGILLKETPEAVVFNCSGCSEVPFDEYVIRGALRLGNELQVKDGEVSIIHDYNSNYSHVVTTESGSKTRIQILKSYRTSGGRGGVSNRIKSGGTPSGAHVIYRKQGEGFRPGQTFDAYKYGFRETVLSPTTGFQAWQSDFITTRVLRLRGLEGELNNNSDKRSILFHGTAEEGLIGYDESAGCIRLSNLDVMDLYDRVKVGTIALIVFKHPRANRLKRSLIEQVDESKVPELRKVQ